MNQIETVQLLKVLTAAGLVRAMEDQGAVWAAFLGDVRVEDAMEVTKKLIREHVGADRWVAVGDITAGVKKLRADRWELAKRDGYGTLAPPESIDPDDTSSMRTWRLALDKAIGDGRDVGAADIIACSAVGVTRPLEITTARPVAQLIEQTARSTRIPAERKTA